MDEINLTELEKELEKYGLTFETYEAVCNDIDDKLECNKDIDWSEIHEKYNVKCAVDTIRKSSSTIFGGYFRLTINEYNERNIAIDYLEGGYLCGIIRKFNSEYTFSKLYKFNKKNYNGLLKLYKEILEVAYKELGEQLKNNA